jgi:hypothetical protein
MKIRFKSDARTLEATPSDRPLSVGRRDGCDLSIIDRSISRLHAELAFRKGDGWYLRDLDSRYGTQVNGLPISAPIRLNEGDHVTFGKIPFTVSLASLEDTGYDTTGLGFMAAPAQPAVVVSRPPAPVASPALPGHDTSPMSRAADAGTRSRKRIIRIPVYSSLDGAIKTVAVLGFIAVTLVVTFLMLRDRGTTQNPRTARDMPATMVDRFPVAPPPPVVPPATPPAAAVAGAPDKTEGDPSAAPGTPAAATKRRPPRRPEPVDVETQPDSAPVSAVGPQRRVTVLAPRMPDGDLEAEQAAMAAAGTESTASPPRAPTPTPPPGPSRAP